MRLAFPLNQTARPQALRSWGTRQQQRRMVLRGASPRCLGFPRQLLTSRASILLEMGPASSSPRFQSFFSLSCRRSPVGLSYESGIVIVSPLLVLLPVNRTCRYARYFGPWLGGGFFIIIINRLAYASHPSVALSDDIHTYTYPGYRIGR